MPQLIYSIYTITDLRTSKIVYVGYTANFPDRKVGHHWNVGRSTLPLYRAMAKYGWNNFAFAIICQSLDGDYCLNCLEPHFIKQLGTRWPHGFNMNDGGGNYCRSKHHRQSISESSKARWSDPIIREKMLAGSRKGVIAATPKGAAISTARWQKRWEVTFPDGHTETIINLNAFCKANGLKQRTMVKTADGQRKSHQGFRCRRL